MHFQQTLTRHLCTVCLVQHDYRITTNRISKYCCETLVTLTLVNCQVINLPNVVMLTHVDSFYVATRMDACHDNGESVVSAKSF